MKLTPEQIKQFKDAIVNLILIVLAICGAVVVDAVTEFGESPATPPVVITDTLTPTEIEDLVIQAVSDYDMADVSTGGDFSFGTTNFDDLELDNLTVSDDITISDDLTVTDDASIGGDLALVGALTAAGSNTLDLLIAEQTELTATTTTVTPTHTFYHLNSAGAVTITLAASATEGQILVLYGDDANTITIADTNIRTSDGNKLTIGQYDIVVMIYDDSEWIELLKLANS